jgi:hypothetical protein
VAFRALDAFLEALGIQSGAQRGRIERVRDDVQLVVPFEWGSEFMVEPSSDSPLNYGSQEVAGTAANRPAALLSEAAATANLTGRQKAIWFWYSIQRMTSAAITTRIVMQVENRGSFAFVGVGPASTNTFNPGQIPTTRNLFTGNSPTAVVTLDGLAHATIAQGVNSMGQFIYGPFFCPASFDVFWCGTLLGVAEIFTVQVWWRELPLLRRG